MDKGHSRNGQWNHNTVFHSNSQYITYELLFVENLTNTNALKYGIGQQNCVNYFKKINLSLKITIKT